MVLIAYDQMPEKNLRGWEEEEIILRLRVATGSGGVACSFDGAVTALEISSGQAVMPGQAALTDEFTILGQL